MMKQLLCLIMSFVMLMQSLPLSVLASEVGAEGDISSGIVSEEKLATLSLGDMYAGTNLGAGDSQTVLETEPEESKSGETEPEETEPEETKPEETELEETKPEETEPEETEPEETEPEETELEGNTDLTDGVWLYRLDEEGHAVITGYLDDTVEYLEIPDQLGSAFVVAIAESALVHLEQLQQLYIHGNVTRIGNNAFPSNVIISGYFGAYAMKYAQIEGYEYENQSAFYFSQGVIDFSDIAGGRYAFAGDTVIRMKPLEASRLTIGSVFYLPASSKYPNGEGFVVESISEDEDWVTLSCRVARGLEIIEQVKVEDLELLPVWSSVETYNGATLTVENLQMRSTYARNRNSAENSKGMKLSVAFPVTEDCDLELSGQFDVSGTLDADISLLKGEIYQLESTTKQEMTGTIELKVKGKGEEEVELESTKKLYEEMNKDLDGVKLFRVMLTGNGLYSIYLDVGLELSISGNIQATYSYSATKGFSYDPISKEIKPIDITEKDFDLFTISGSAKLNFTAATKLEIALLGDIAELKFSIGFSLKVTLDPEFKSCLDVKVEFFADLKFKFTLKLETNGPKYEYEQEYTLLEIKIPLAIVHLEFFTQTHLIVDKCTYNDKVAHTVTFEFGNGDQYLEKVYDGQTVSPPGDIKQANATLLGWTYDDPLTTAVDMVYWNFSQPIKQSMTLHANWDYTSGTVSGGNSGYYTAAEDLIYDKYLNNEAWVYGCSSGVTHLVIPPEIDGRTVTTIPNYSDFRNVVSVTIPSTVNSIGTAFEYCSNLEEVVIEGPVEEIGAGAFAYCEKLRSVTFNGSVTRIGAEAFIGCTSLEEVSMPEGLKQIGSGVFQDCTGLKTVHIPEGYTGTGEQTFMGCSSLETVELPSTLKKIWDSAFAYCSSLKSIEIPDNVLEIERHAFYHSTNLQSISIPDHVTTIGNSAFAECTNLSSVQIGSAVSVIDYGAFNDCTSLNEVTLGNNITSIGGYVFANCKSLESIILPESNVSYGQGVFYGCSSLSRVQLPVSMTTIPASMFAYCDLREIHLPTVLTEIQSRAFSGCSFKEVHLPIGLTEIGASAFSKCDELTSILIPETVTTLGKEVFYHCSSLESAVIPSSVTEIGENAFHSCEKVKILGETGSTAETFAKNGRISFIPINYSEKVPDNRYYLTFYSEGVDNSIFLRLSSGMEVPKPANPVRKGYTFTGWYKESACETLWDFETGVMPDSNLILYAGWEEALSDYSFVEADNGLTVTSYTGTLKKITIPSAVNGKSVVAIAAGAFEQCSLTAITIPDSVTEIADGAFAGCDRLSSIQVSASNPSYTAVDNVLLAKDGRRLIRYAPGQTKTEYIVPDTVEHIDSYAFLYAGYLESLSLPAGLCSLGDSAFAYCKELKVLQFPDGITSIGTKLFDGCDWDLQLYGPSTDCPIKNYALEQYIDYNLYTVNYYNGDSKYFSRKVQAGELLPEVQEPHDGIMHFDGWYKDAALTDAWDMDTDVMPADNISLYMKWACEYAYVVNEAVPATDEGLKTVTITGYSGTDAFLILPEEILGMKVTGIAPGAFDTSRGELYELTIPSCIVEIAEGAIQGKSVQDKIKIICDVGSAAASYAETYGTGQNLVSEVRKYTVTFETNGGRSVESVLQIPGEYVDLPESVRDNYSLDGWYKDATWTDIWNETADVMPCGDVILYAKWTKVDETIDDIVFAYTSQNGEVTIHGYQGNNNFIVIPNYINGEPVTEIAPFFLQQDDRVQRITIPENIEKVGRFAFQNSSIQKIVIEGTNEITIDEGAFSDNPYLSEIIINRKLPNISESLFANCTSLLTIDIPESVEQIGEAAFYGCRNIRKLTIPQTVVTIGSSAFADCYALREVQFLGAVPNGLDNTTCRNTHVDLTFVYTEGKNGWTMPVLSIAQPDGTSCVFNTTCMNTDNVYIQTLQANWRNTVVGETITWTAYAGEGNWEYLFELYCNDVLVEKTEYTESSIYTHLADTAGTYSLSVTARDDQGRETAPRESSVHVNKKTVGIAALEFASSLLTMNVGETQDLMVSILPENATDPALMWTSSNPNVATVDNSGKVSAQAIGYTTIQVASANGIEATCLVYVSIEIPPSITIELPEKEIYIGDSGQLRIHYQNFEIIPDVIWSSNNPEIATVDSQGVVFGHMPGTATIMAVSADNSEIVGTADIKIKSLAIIEGEYWIEEDVTLMQNVVVSEGATVYIAEGVTVTVPAGIELNIQGYVEVYGNLIFEDGGILTITDKYVKCLNIWTGKLDVTKADLSGIYYGSVGIQLNSSAEIKGIPDEMLYATTYVYSTEDVNAALALASNYVYLDLMVDSSFTLTNSITIPDNVEFFIWQWDIDADLPTVVVPNGVTVTNNGWFTLDSGRFVVEEGGQLINNNYTAAYGVLLMFGGFQQNGTLDGTYYGSTMSQADLESALSYCVENGYAWVHENATTIHSDMTIDLGEKEFRLSKYGRIIVADGATLTVNSSMNTGTYDYGELECGQIIVEDGGKLIISGDLQTHDTDHAELILESGSHLVINGRIFANEFIQIGKDAVVEVNGYWIGRAPINNGGTILPTVTNISVIADNSEIDPDTTTYVTLQVSVAPNKVHGATWASSDPDIIDPTQITDFGEGKYRAYLGGKTGAVTLTATSIDGSGKTAAINLLVGDVVENRVTLIAADLNGQTSVWIDGVEYAVQSDGDVCYVDLPDGNAKTMTAYTYHIGDASDIHTQYPVSMKVWTLSCEDGIYTATREEELDDILQYSGSSIRVTGKQGIRMITSIDKAKKSALISDGLAGYTLKEYGTVVAWSRQLGDNPMVLGMSYSKSNYAYKKGVADPVFAYDGSLMQYTNVLVGFSASQCKNDLVMRPYMILENMDGNEITIYGGTVTRSIGYIALQNKDTFDEGTEAYDYVWDIIYSVYGDTYDKVKVA